MVKVEIVFTDFDEQIGNETEKYESTKISYCGALKR
jgi:hypothetical protein